MDGVKLYESVCDGLTASQANMVKNGLFFQYDNYEYITRPADGRYEVAVLSSAAGLRLIDFISLNTLKKWAAGYKAALRAHCSL